MSALDFLDEELALLEARHRRRVPRVLGGRQGARIRLDGRDVVSFSSNDYLGLAAHPALVAAAHRALEEYGVGAGASRLIVGNTPAHVALEADVATLVGTRSARVFNSGYAANTGVLPVLAGRGDQIFSDSLNHASIIDGCRLARAELSVYPHGDTGALAEQLASSAARRKVVVTESVFSMDGDVADLAALRAIADAHGAILVVDEAHAVGVFGDGGGGALAAAGVQADVVMATLGKAVGAYGAAVAGPVALSEILWNRARPLVFTTGTPPSVAAAASAGVALIRSPEGAARRRLLWARLRELGDGLRGLGIAAPVSSPIVPVLVGDDRAVMAWTAHLLEHAVFVQGIRPPTVPEGSARLRITVSADHTPEDVQRLLEAMASGLESGLPLRST